MENQLKVSPSIFYPTFESKARRIVHQGGQWSGKTVNILAVLATKALLTPNLVITVTSESLPHLRIGALRDFERFILPYFKAQCRITYSPFIVCTFANGSIIEFKSFQDEYDARGAKRNILFINEANRFSYMVYFQLDSRSDQTILDFNPTARFWAHDEVLPLEGTQLFISDHRHNPFLTEERHREIENIKDKELWRVYARGLTGNMEGIIYPNWRVIPDAEFPDVDFIFGCDIGYTNDPTAIVKVAIIGNTIFLKELCYESGLPPIKIVQILKANGYNGDTPIYCDHDPDFITQLRRLSVMALPARKGQGSVNAGIMKLKEYDVCYTASSRNIAEERSRYVWLKDPKTGKSINEPIGTFDHTLAAVRYAVYTHFYRSK
jgi:phage terminase large subunit